MAGRNYRAEALAGDGRQMIAGPSTQAAGPVVNIGRLQSTDAEQAMLDRALEEGGSARNAYDAIGGLAQVWAARSSMKKKETANESALARALAGAGLDPDLANVAQLGGTQEDLVQAVALQRQRRTDTETRQWRQDERDYQRGRDTVEDQRYGSEQTYKAERDRVSDARADRKEEPYRTLTPDEATQLGLPIGQSYQMGPNGKLDTITAPSRTGGGDTKTSLNPVYGTDEAGRPVLLQPRDDGTVVQSKLPQGVTVSTGVEKIDAGTHWVLQDKRSGQTVGAIPKENFQEASEKAQGTAEGKARGEAVASMPGAAGVSQMIADQVEGLKTDPYRPEMLGAVNSRLPNLSSSAARVQSKMDQLQGGAFLQARQFLKGQGQITDFESKRAEAAMIRLNAAQTPEDYSQALDEFSDAVRSGYEKVQQTAGQGAPAPAPRVPGAGAADYRSKYGLE